jgi:tRNA U55 pseudouridine synthase TruB
MGRKPSPLGKDRTRTISLAGDVAELAQYLADQGKLSATISELLRQQYGIGSKVNELKLQLNQTIDRRKELQDKETELIKALDRAEADKLELQDTALPALRSRREVLLARRDKLNLKYDRSFTPTESSKLLNQLMNTRDLLTEIENQIEDLELQ